jgi:hypothetical protein
VSKLREDLRVGVLGAAAGVFSVSAFLLAARVDSYYEYLNWLEITEFSRYERRVEDLWWIPILLVQVSLSILAAVVVHRYLATRVRAPFLLWQVIGAGSLLGWGLLIFLAFSVDLVMRGNLDSVDHAFRLIDFANLAKYIAALVACHVFYGSLIKAAARQYAE